MKMQLAQNISRMRRERDMTQERLAEALGVTFAAVSKWERGVATPELSTIMELADLFSVSVDALLGYEMRENDLPSVVERLRDLSHTREKSDWQGEAQQALRRFPNHFDVVYFSAVLYSVHGIDEGMEEYRRMALVLFQQADRLAKQNTRAEISKLSIRQQIAMAHMMLGENEKGLEILKKNNPCGIHNALIGMRLACNMSRPDEAIPYLSEALLDLSMSHMNLTMGYVNAYWKKENYKEADAVLEWALAFYPGLKEKGMINHLEKSEALLWALRAAVQMKLQQMERAMASLRAAYKTAIHFDAAPDYNANHVRFVECGRLATSHDDFGETALKGVESLVLNQQNDALSRMWKEIRNGT